MTFISMTIMLVKPRQNDRVCRLFKNDTIDLEVLYVSDTEKDVFLKS